MRRALIVISGALCLAVAAAQAQPAGNTTTTAPPAGGGMGMGPHEIRGPSGMGRGMRAGPGYTMGWSMMTPEERQEHWTKMMAFKTAKECRAYVEEHHRLMADRAKQRGVAISPSPMHDPCAGLK